MNRMDGKVCVVTGSTQGMAIARRLAEAGAAGLLPSGAVRRKAAPGHKRSRA
jgi:NAD(P)-dependent dehydrogenase (short-subunit alcohol dehydrogenase family)